LPHATGKKEKENKKEGYILYCIHFKNPLPCLIQLRQKVEQIERFSNHKEISIFINWPLVGGAVCIEFDAVAIGVFEVDGFRDTMVRGALNFVINLEQSFNDFGKLSSVRVEEAEVIEPGMTIRRRDSVVSCPGIQTDMVMVAAG
jgi:hypothetical protein